MVFRLVQEQALSLCGIENNCVVNVNGEELATSQTTLPDGSIEFRATVTGSGGGLHCVLVFDSTIGGSGVNLAVDQNTGNEFSVEGDVIQTTLTSEGYAVVTAGDNGGQMTVSFTLTPEQDMVKCANLPYVCSILENRAIDLPTERLVLADSRVRYTTTVILEAGAVNLYSLKVLDTQSPTVGDISLSVPVIRGGDSVVFQINVTDNTRIVHVLCRHTLPDGRVIEVDALQLNDGTWEWDFIPPSNSPSGYVNIEVVVTDLGGNTVTVQPLTAQGQPATVLLDNDTPHVILPQSPIIAPRFFNNTAVADRGECVNLTVTASDATTSIDDLIFVITQPDGNEIEVSGTSSATITGLYSGEFCIDVNAPSGEHKVRVIATDLARNQTIIICKSFIVNTPPEVNAGEDIWISPGQDATFSGSFTDPDPLDTHSIDWQLGDGTSASNSLTPPKSYLESGVYTATLTVTDSFGGIGSDQRVIYVVGDGTLGDPKGLGFWKHQFNSAIKNGDDDGGKGKGKGNNKGSRQHISSENILFYMTLIRQISNVFDEIASLTTLDDGAAIIDIKHPSRLQRTMQHTLTVWLNFAHGAIRLNDLVDIDADGVADLSFNDAMTLIESIILDPNATKHELENAQDMAESIHERF